MNGIKGMISSRLMYELQTNTMQLRGDYTVFCSMKYKKSKNRIDCDYEKTTGSIYLKFWQKFLLMSTTEIQK